MQKLITAGAALLLVGIGAFSATYSDAQRATRTTLGELIEEDDEVRIVEKEVKPTTVLTTQDFLPLQIMPHNQPGTWQIVTHEDFILLLNTASGETYHLDDRDDKLLWKSIPRDDIKTNDMYRLPTMPRAKRDPINPERIEERLKELRKQLEDARGEARERLERAVEELERKREKHGEPGPEERKGDARRHVEELEEVIDELEVKIRDLKKRWEESDSVREREKLEKAVKELKEEADRIRKELKESRR